MQAEFQRRAGSFGPNDPWFEPRARAFWDDALTTQGFARLALRSLDAAARELVPSLARAHRGLFVVEDIDPRAARILDLWSGAELWIRLLDDDQACALEHVEGAFDGRVVACSSGPELFLLPGAYHHPADALEPSRRVLLAARDLGMETGPTLDALLRMELVLRASSRVKAGFAYRTEALQTPSSAALRTPMHAVDREPPGR